jgi:quinolinate synthase
MTDVELRTCPPQQFTDWDEWSHEVRRLATELNALILAHNYQRPEIQDVADHVGDSLALSRLAAAARQSTIVCASVHFMAETAKILSPDKRVVVSTLTATAARNRTESRGCHQRSDFPDPEPEWHRHQLLRLIDGEIQQLHGESAVAA